MSRNRNESSRRWVRVVTLLYVGTLILAVCGLIGVFERKVLAAEPAWLVGDALKSHLEQDRFGVTWSEAPLRNSLRDLGRAQKIPVLLDRRIDPGQLLDVTIKDQPLQTGLQQIAEKAKLGVGWVGGVAYFGPVKTAERVRTLAALRNQEVGKLPTSLKQKFAKNKVWRWDELATPRDLLTELATEAGVKFSGGDVIPHDLWAAADWPALTWSERMTLVLAQYDLTFEVSATGDSVKFVPLPDKLLITKTYTGATNTADNVQKLKHLLPHSRIELASGKLTVEATAEDHDMVAEFLAGKKVTKTTGPEIKKIEKLAVQNIPVGKLLAALGPKLDLTVKIDEGAIRAANISLDQLVSVNLQNATVDDVFKAACKETGLAYRIQDKTVEIFPAK